MTRRSECAIRTKRHTLRRACQIYSDIRLDDEMIFFLEYLLLEEESAPKRPSSRRKGIFDTAAEAEAFFPRNRFFRHSTLFFEKKRFTCNFPWVDSHMGPRDRLERVSVPRRPFRPG